MLYSEQMKLIIDKFGLDPSTLPDNLYSTLLDAIYKLDVGSGGGKPTQTKNVTIDENGTTNIVPDSGYTLSQVTVNVDVEDTPTQVKSIDVTENGDVYVTPDNGYVLSRVDINVDVEGESTPTQTKTIDITTNGTTEVTPDSGYALSKVTVNTNVATSGGGDNSKISTGYFTIGDDITSDVVITHGLGVKPYYLAIIAASNSLSAYSEQPPPATRYLAAIQFKGSTTVRYGVSGIITKSSTPIFGTGSFADSDTGTSGVYRYLGFTTNDFTLKQKNISSSYGLGAGQTYYWIAIAEGTIY